MHILCLLTVLQIVSLENAFNFNFTCPSQAHWKLRARSMCKPPRNYTCLYDVTQRVKGYREECGRPRLLHAGYKYVFQPRLNRAKCSSTRFQPYIFNTEVYSDCNLLKSFCNSGGQIIYGNGTTTSDRTCFCDTNTGYTFVTKPKLQSSCIPSQEDCSCYIDIYQNNTAIDSKDGNEDSIKLINRNRIKGNTFKTHRKQNKVYDDVEYNITFPTSLYRTEAFKWIFILCILYLFSTAGISIVHITNTARQKLTPRHFAIVNCTDNSITVEWYLHELDDNLMYQIRYRSQRLLTWDTLKLTTEDISVETNGRRTYTLQKLLPATRYEVTMCSVKNHKTSLYTDNIIGQTLEP